MTEAAGGRWQAAPSEKGRTWSFEEIQQLLDELALRVPKSESPGGQGSGKLVKANDPGYLHHACPTCGSYEAELLSLSETAPYVEERLCVHCQQRWTFRGLLLRNDPSVAPLKRADVRELHYITPMRNLPSIAQQGILCHRRAQEHSPDSFALESAQGRRKARKICGERSVHDYVNLYLNARNVAMYSLTRERRDVAVLKVSSTLLDRIAGLVIADGNLAAPHSQTFLGVANLGKVDKLAVQARSWVRPTGIKRLDAMSTAERKRRLCAEVLVPERVPPEFIEGVYASNNMMAAAAELLYPVVPTSLRPDLFFDAEF